MIHFGLERLVYLVNFHVSCYYPILFEEKKTKILFGVSFGLLNCKSINVSWRPSDRLEQIDLFADINTNGVVSKSYIGTIECSKNYEIKIKRESRYNMYWIRVMDGAKVIHSYSSDFKYPFINVGLITKRTSAHKILLKRKPS